MINQPFTDTFLDDRNCGKTIGSKTNSGVVRTGTDREKAISIDHQALRFQPLIQPGWGRQGIAYGEYQRTNGLAVAVLLLNGHNTSQAENIEWLYKRITQWLRGNETESVGRRFVAWLGSQQKSATPRRLLGWLRMSSEVNKFFPLPKVNDNLAVGWFERVVPNDPTQIGNGFVVRATGAENGELLARVGTKLLSVFRGLQNIPVYYAVVLREQGAAYYAASLPGVYGLPAYPELRPVAIDAVDSEAVLYAGVHQSVIGQIGFRADTRIYGVKVEQVAQLATWYGTAHVADSLIGQGDLTDSPAEKGAWQVLSGRWKRTKQGLTAIENNSLAILDPQAASGLLHLKIFTGKTSQELAIIWRFQDRDNYWCCRFDNQQVYLELVEAGQAKRIFDSDQYFIESNSVTYLQILDDGQEFRVYLNSQLIGDRSFIDRQLATATGVGIAMSQVNSETCVQNLEAHPRTVTIPDLELNLPWWRKGTSITIQDNFSAWQGELSGKTTALGDRVWQKTIGKGAFKIQSGIAKVDASVEHPNPEPTAYTVAWNNPGFADLEVTIFPPGKERGQGEKGRGGLIFWQDEDNYIIINTWLDDFYEGESISCFFRIAGYEEIYDAVWSNIGKAIAFGQPYTLRVAFDGNDYVVLVNEQTVLYRALTDIYPWTNSLKIERVGIVANWEWGNDTGSGFSNFIVKK